MDMENRLLFSDFIHFEDDNRVRMKFNIDDGDNEKARESFAKDTNSAKDYIFWHYKNGTPKLNPGDIGVGFARMPDDSAVWLLIGIYRVIKDLGVKGGVGYEAEPIAEYDKYVGRMVVRYKNTHTYGTPIKTYAEIGELEVLRIDGSVYNGEGFQGYDNVRLSYKQLRTIVYNNNQQWVNALSNLRAVYLITDLSSGKQYIGSATAEDGMLLARWTSYIENGHGGNKLLKEIVDNCGEEYIHEHFQYSILQTFDDYRKKDEILKREAWWKESLGSRAFGLNVK